MREYLTRKVEMISVWRYHLEALGHIALMMLFTGYYVAELTVRNVLIVVALYTLLGKIIWYARKGTFNPKDTIFDFCKNSLVMFPAITSYFGITFGFIFLVTWIAVYSYLGAEKHWSSP